ncbi:phage virion morphogenesis protein [Falsiroseomonas sp.]|uniref:phage virion morphogenesis protein n=1 Tax=Falsiroseomonas sp. TaxID=2870721 RepID=UPI003F701122
MTGVTLSVEIRDAQIAGAVAQLRFAFSRPEELTQPIGIRLRDNAQDRFKLERAPDGTPWAPLNPLYAEIKEGPGILRGRDWNRSGLNNSLVHQAAGWDVAIGSNKIYAAVHQFGAVIKPRRAGMLTLRTPSGAIWGVAKEVTIPARPYLGLSDEDRRDVLDIVEDRFGLAMRPRSASPD